MYFHATIPFARRPLSMSAFATLLSPVVPLPIQLSRSLCIFCHSFGAQFSVQLFCAFRPIHLHRHRITPFSCRYPWLASDQPQDKRAKSSIEAPDNGTPFCVQHQTFRPLLLARFAPNVWVNSMDVVLIHETSGHTSDDTAPYCIGCKTQLQFAYEITLNCRISWRICAVYTPAEWPWSKRVTVGRLYAGVNKHTYIHALAEHILCEPQRSFV